MRGRLAGRSGSDAVLSFSVILVDTSAWIEFLRNTGSRVCFPVDDLPARDRCLIAAPAIRAGAAVLHNDADFDVLARHTELRIYEGEAGVSGAPPPG